ncbi:MAG: hypothetical protein FWG42_02920 [Clostridiales bacterium]|nr:hypothetical protein [Clostridiales bacterium]
MDLQDRVLFIARIAREPNIGKTAMMKYLYLLQTVEKVPLGYSFEIYTYGPYSSEAMSEIDHASQNGYISVLGVTFPSGVYGYSITCDSKGEMLLTESPVISAYQTQINVIVHAFSGKTAKELELLSTIVYIALMHDKNDWGMSEEDICASVQDVKPQFTLSEISANYRFLLDNQFLSKALQ